MDLQKTYNKLSFTIMICRKYDKSYQTFPKIFWSLKGFYIYMNIYKILLPPDARDKAKTNRKNLLKDHTTGLTNSGKLNIDMKFTEKDSHDSLCQKNEKSCL